MASGAPDYTKFLWPARDKMIDGQVRTHGSVPHVVTAGNTDEVNLVVVGAKEICYVGNVSITCDDNFFQIVKLKAGAVEFAQRIICGATTFTGESHAGMTVESGDTLAAVLFNDDSIAHAYIIQYVATIQEL